MSRMFQVPTKQGLQTMTTWNVFIGCRFDCVYCSARRLALGRLKHTPRYQDGFLPRYVQVESQRRFKQGDFIFVAYMGDISFCPRNRVEEILARVRWTPGNNFLFCSKNPGIYSKWNLPFPPNLYLATTIETNRDQYGLTRAPSPLLRMRDFARVDHAHKLVSVEPVMDFDPHVLVSWLHFLKPEIIEVGADNYHNHLEEPSSPKLKELLEDLRAFVPNLVEKEGLGRLMP